MLPCFGLLNNIKHKEQRCILCLDNVFGRFKTQIPFSNVLRSNANQFERKSLSIKVDFCRTELIRIKRRFFSNDEIITISKLKLP